jgi:hypothetical protein
VAARPTEKTIDNTIQNVRRDTSLGTPPEE